MQAYCLPPGMQNGYHTCLYTQPFCILAKTIYRISHRIKQNVVHGCRLVQTQLMERIGQGEHHIKIRPRQQLCFQFLYPLFFLCTLAFRAVPVAATVITNAQVAATDTAIYMAAVGSGTATPEFTKGTQLPTVDSSTLYYLQLMCIQHISHFYFSRY